MTTTATVNPRASSMRSGFPPSFKKEGIVYAIAFDMDIAQLRIHYGDPYNGAYLEIRQILESRGFTWQQGSVYFGGSQILALDCMLAAQHLAQTLPWFADCVRDIRMLRIEELNDLMPAIRQVMNRPT